MFYAFMVKKTPKQTEVYDRYFSKRGKGCILTNGCSKNPKLNVAHFINRPLLSDFKVIFPFFPVLESLYFGV